MARVDKKILFHLTTWKNKFILKISDRTKVDKKRGEMMSRLNELAGYRSKLNKTQKDFANLIGVSNQAYSSKENGRTPFKPNEMKILKEFISQHYPSVTIDILFF